MEIPIQGLRVHHQNLTPNRRGDGIQVATVQEIGQRHISFGQKPKQDLLDGQQNQYGSNTRRPTEQTTVLPRIAFGFRPPYTIGGANANKK